MSGGFGPREADAPTVNPSPPLVIVAGGGMSGLAAACAASESGIAVRLMEKGTDLGGSLRLSNGFLVTYDDMDAIAAAVPEGDPGLQRAVVEGFPEACRWLGTMGVHLSPIRRVGGRSGHRFDPSEVVETLRRQLLERGAVIDLGCSVRSLVRADGAVVGVELAGHRQLELSASAVILATGGFQGNPELLARLCGLHIGGLYHRANPWSTGDGLLAALGVGATTSRLTSGFYGHAMAAPPAVVDETTYAPLTQYQGCDSVALNLEGHRFADESVGTGEEVLNQQLARQPGQLGFYVGDDEISSLEAPAGSGTTVRLILERTESLGGIVHRSPTLEHLCRKLAATGVDESTALETLRAYQSSIKGSTATVGGGRPGRRRAMDRPPYWAVKVRPAITFTTGGIAVDARMGVVDRAGSPSVMATESSHSTVGPSVIRGLFACGADVGGISGNNYAGGLATALVTGWLAGKAAAGDALAPSARGRSWPLMPGEAGRCRKVAP